MTDLTEQDREALVAAASDEELCAVAASIVRAHGATLRDEYAQLAGALYRETRQAGELRGRLIAAEARVDLYRGQCVRFKARVERVGALLAEAERRTEASLMMDFTGERWPQPISQDALRHALWGDA